MDVDEELNEEVDVLVDVLDVGIFNEQWQEQPLIFSCPGKISLALTIPEDAEREDLTSSTILQI